jgi:PhzF family phenazine biosynthesis protein
MKLDIFQIDAFTDKVFGGNPAAVIPLSHWLDDETLQHIATENNLSETAFFVKKQDVFELRWFTPVAEVNLCGHATLAAAFVLFEELKHPEDSIRFSIKSGLLEVRKKEKSIELNFPVDSLEKGDVANYQSLFNKKPKEAWKGKEDVLLVFQDEDEVQQLIPNLAKIATTPCRGVVASAKGNQVDFVSRFFTPQLGINEDPVTGSAHTSLVPFWAKKLKKSQFEAKQISKRGGDLVCEIKENRVFISGQAVCFMKGEISI